MGFFNTFSEISKNQDNFRQWEQNKADEEAKRAQYLAQNPISEKEKKDSAEFGRVIVDTIDFMDAKSENKSESVELASEMTTGVVTEVAGIGSLIMVAKDHAKKLEKLKETHKKIDELIYKLNNKNEDFPNKEAIKQDLLKNKLVHSYGDKEYSHIYQKKAPFSGASMLLDEINLSKLNPETKKYFSETITEEAIKQAQKTKGLGNRLLLIPGLITLGLGAAGQIVGTILQVRASKIARFQAREELNDTRNFVEYTDEQKAQAQQVAAGIKVPEEKNSGSIKDIRSLMKSYGAYQANSKQMDNTHLYEIQEKDPKKAYEQQKIINKVTTKINNTAEEYSENMETAAGVVLGSSVLGGAAFGKLSEFILKKVDEYKNKGKTATEIEKAAEEKAAKIAEKMKTASKNKRTFHEIKQALKLAAKTNPGMFGGLLGVIIAAPFATRLQKNASRAGRYQAKRDFEENPQNFVIVEDEKLNQINAKGVAKKSGFLDVIKSIPKSLKAISEYKKYKKDILPKKKAMQEALKQTNITPEQMQKAESLKTRLYKSFDVIDDHSQEYSEKMEAATEITKDTMNTATMFATIVPAALFLKKPEKFIKPLTGIVKTVFEKANGFATKYTKNLGQHMIDTTNKKVKRSWLYRELSVAEKEIDDILKTTDKAEFETKIASLQEKHKGKIDDHHLEMIRKAKGGDFVIIKGYKISNKMDQIIEPNSTQYSKEIINLQSEFEKIINGDKKSYEEGYKHFLDLNSKELEPFKDNFIKVIDEAEETPKMTSEVKQKLKELIQNPAKALEEAKAQASPEQAEGGLKELATLLKAMNDPKQLKQHLNDLSKGLGLSHVDFAKMSDKDILKAKDNVVTIMEKIPEKELTESIQKHNEYLKNNPFKQMIVNEANLKLSTKDKFLSNDVKPIFYGVGAAYVGGMVTATYAVDSYMSAKTKEAGRLGTMKAMDELNNENDQFIKRNQK